MPGEVDERDDWPVGLLFSQTGPTAFIEQTQLNATLLAIEQINAAGGVRGRPLRPVIEDPGGDAAAYGVAADRILDRYPGSVLFGCYMSSTRKAVLPVVERRGALLAYPAPYEGFEYSPNILYTGAAPNQSIVQLARYLIRHVGRRFYFVGTRYVFPIEANRILATLVAERKGQVVAERYVRLDSKRRAFDDIVRDIREKRPDGIFSTVIGETAVSFYAAYREAGLDPRDMPIASLTTTEAEVALMGAAVAEGHITAATYFQSVSTPANTAFVAAYKARFGADAMTNAMAESAYFQTLLVAQAIETVGSQDPGRLRPALLQAGIAAPQGHVQVDADNNHCWLWPRIGRAEASGEFALLEEASVPVKPDPYMLTHGLDDWGDAARGTPAFQRV